VARQPASRVATHVYSGEQTPLSLSSPAILSRPLHPMRDSSVILFDSGRFSLWLRVPALVFGLFALCLAVSCVASNLLAAFGCFAIATLWIFVWFAQVRVWFDAERQELIEQRRGFLGIHERRLSLAGCRGFRVCRVSTGLAKRTWRFTFDFTDGRSDWFIDIDDSSRVDSFMDSLTAATKLPATKNEAVA